MATTIYVQFSDESEQTIISMFSAEQDPSNYPNQATITTSDPRYLTYYSALPEFVQASLPSPTDD
ncbi:hypothetical protein ACL598_16760 [Bordetella bronchialis]|uniref:hypothetical protein n=1 Tax=Bordetella bronchialis TaxID=463025 RepID=UPI003D04BD81